MKEIVNITKEILSDALYAVHYFIGDNIRKFAKLLTFILPYAMLLIGEYVYKFRRGFAIGGEVFIPIFVGLIVYYLKSFSNKIGKGESVPSPKKRFTTVDEDGEVSIETSRTHELILYVADLEDWLERKGML